MFSQNNNVVQLKNGQQAPKDMVSAICMSLQKLMEAMPGGGLEELFDKCQNPSHKMFGNSQQICQELGLLDSNGNVKTTVKYIVLSAVTEVEENGERLDVILGSPIIDTSVAASSSPRNKF